VERLAIVDTMRDEKEKPKEKEEEKKNQR